MDKLKLSITSVVGIVCVSLIALLASGCGDDDPGSSTHELVGTWSLEQMIINYTIGGQTTIDTLTPDEDTISGNLTCEEDNFFTSTMKILGQTLPMDGSWGTEGDSLILIPLDTINNDTVSVQYTISGTTLLISGIMFLQGIPVPITMVQTWIKQKLIGYRRLGI